MNMIRRSISGRSGRKPGQREDHPGDRGSPGRGRRYHPAAGGRDGNELERKVNRIEQCNEGSAL